MKRVALLTYTANGSKLRKALTMKTEINFTDQTIQMLIYVSNESFIEKVRSATWCIFLRLIQKWSICDAS